MNSVTWTEDGWTMRLPVTGMVHTPGDCIDFYVQDGRSFRFTGDGMDMLVLASVWEAAAERAAPFAIRLPRRPAFHPAVQ